MRSSLSSNDSVGIMGGGLDSEKDAHSTGDDGVDVGSPGVASDEEVTPLSLRPLGGTLRLPIGKFELELALVLALVTLE